jgi:polysaccharide biosynthesis protein PslH
MQPLLYLVHRIPYPPNKGDKVRSFHLLEYLSQHFDVHLGTFVDAAADVQHVSRLRDWCVSCKAVRLVPGAARLRSIGGLWRREPLSVAYYRSRLLEQWVRTTVREHGIEQAVVFSSVMAQHLQGIDGLRTVVDFVDVDSAKWEQFAQSHAWPLSSVFRREGRHLREYERRTALASDAAVFVTASEKELFCSVAPECAARAHVVRNGVNSDYFSPLTELPNPYDADHEPIVFTGAMDYWPNVDAVCWFAECAFPAIAAARPRARFHIVGMRPAPAVRALARDARIVVTGTVPDVRPYLRHARAVVAPMRIARGIQNKVLEAMAMQCAVVVSEAAARSLGGVPGLEYEVARDADELVAKTLAVMDPSHATKIGIAARERVVSDCSWNRNLAPLLDLLNRAPSSPQPLRAARHPETTPVQ